MSAYGNEMYGLIMMLIFTLIITVGFVFELGKGALKIDSRQGGIAPSKTKNIIFMFDSK